MRTRAIVISIIIAALILTSSGVYAANSNAIGGPRFAIPVKCTMGKDCYIMHYVDSAPGREAVDFSCGRQTYNGHDGTDFGIADLQAMGAGVPVIASAAGVILGTRDGMTDRLVAEESDRTVIKNFECGNGVVIDHGNGWQTQYCHMRKGSLIVKPSERVEKGAILGMVGASGPASFPHVHFTIRYHGRIVDPFVGITDVTGCKAPRYPLWEQSLDYVPTGLIRAGFSFKPPKQMELWQGQFSEARLQSDNLPLLIFWVHVYGVLQGDKERFTMKAPNGNIIIDVEKNITKSARSWVHYVGKNNTRERPLPKGTWRASYQLKRGERLLINLEREVIIE
ncbi:MAG: peptidase M23 [Syntrophus sp. (in: bacteria)]|nr:peptidase M23 [Syntrophus sp. (in: bacteria)]